jgi:hypothetical protein
VLIEGRSHLLDRPPITTTHLLLLSSDLIGHQERRDYVQIPNPDATIKPRITRQIAAPASTSCT